MLADSAVHIRKLPTNAIPGGLVVNAAGAPLPDCPYEPNGAAAKHSLTTVTPRKIIVGTTGLSNTNLPTVHTNRWAKYECWAVGAVGSACKHARVLLFVRAHSKATREWLITITAGDKRRGRHPVVY
jgi:hypothetical protein